MLLSQPSSSVRIALLFSFLLPWFGLVGASLVPCNQTAECEAALGMGSMCGGNGLCTNTFYNGGCLKSVLPNWNRTRVCNSQDPPEAEALGYCHHSSMDYVEVRVAGRAWESINFNAWILQIVLSEMLDIPTSIEAGVPDMNLNFYDPQSGFEYWNAFTHITSSELLKAAEVGDCRVVKNSQDPENYQGCFHVYPEAWTEDHAAGFEIEGSEPYRDNGLMGENAMSIPKFAAEADPSLGTYIGLRGQKNRRKVAETFKRPTRWGQYCREVSLTSCAESDPIAQRAPETEEEEKKFFVAGLYNGHFRHTEESNCDKYPTNCTGHFVDFGCGWISFAQAQAYHLDIAFAFEGPQGNGGYSYGEAVQIWSAANATKSPVAFMWWSPEPLPELYSGTDAEFTRIQFPTPTQECVNNRMDFSKQCDPDIPYEEKMGDPAGVCDTYPYPLKRILSTGLIEISENPDVNTAFWSPAHEVASSLRVNNLQMAQIFRFWQQRSSDPGNFDPRAAVCQWVGENLDLLQANIPKSHPRVIEEVASSDGSLFKAALAIAIMAAVLVSVSIAFTYIKRKTKVIYYAQSEFLILIQVGMLLTIGSAVTSSLSPSNTTCGFTIWLKNTGYVLQLVPLLIRISAINQLAASGKQMQRVRLNIWKLHAVVAVAAALVAVFLLVWTLVDPPQEQFQYKVTDLVTPTGDTVVEAFGYCGSENDFWYFVQMGWKGAVLVPACLIAFLTLRVKEDLNDTRSLAVMLFIRIFFLIASLCAGLLMQEANAVSDLMGCWSLLISLDTILSVAVYIVPKFWDSGENLDAEPLPDVFVHTTVALLDITGFTAWSSVREPVQVFQLLEQLFQNFDQIAQENGVYKVETVRESYVAATGIPKPQSDHAVLMARFVGQCMKKMPKYLRNLEIQFGPDTSDMSLRAGLHSGPVTGGFLKGKGSRFQLFGDTVSTALLIQRYSVTGRIHLSEETAALLVKAGKKRWVLEREDKVDTIEKGELKTYWLIKGGQFSDLDYQDFSVYAASSVGDDSDADGEEELESLQRWIEWNVEVFKGLLKQILARRAALLMRASAKPFTLTSTDFSAGSTMPLEEVKEIIELPKFDRKAARRLRENADVEVPEDVVQQLRLFITEVADLYNNDNAFHNFAHASYVVMAMTKYLNRIIAATEVDLGDNEERFRSSVQAALHDHTYGIASDPLTHFACLFSALIHDADHPGVPNDQLVKENETAARKYQNRSVAEQKSFDMGIDLLNEDRFEALRAAVCVGPQEVSRFRALVVNSVMATDLGDKVLKELRNGRWEKAFCNSGTDTSTTETISGEEESQSPVPKTLDAVNRKATIVIEHLIQAADVAHMSQHWMIYRKWNERLFREIYKAYREGRAENNPADGWYKGEIGFFDFYIIPLSQKLSDCGVFGPTSAENLNYARNNRNMWVKEGEAITAEMLAKVEQEYLQEQAVPADELIEV
ncbi:Receptor-type guanylate cyclase gcy [Seminavis robusta]|uniref:Receptor-type guanylate cyclase gcy n=1 Tax=Seminavis robusta TaxID=568900 RepID=A0A9N8EM13_9STRA|nr:Receptor-type guanylate cyclase gcy [Seminavis robusta]|eukprot:Sro1311_g261760.1 Receptor-type guanylate cyclase gcy (1456) ;mRNA; f:10147-15246